jgi:hypothetical protein
MTFEQASFEDPDLKDLGPIKDKHGISRIIGPLSHF